MGTNFYGRFGPCDCCGRGDEHHIGKSKYITRVYPAGLTIGDQLVEIDSWADWEELLLGEVGDRAEVRIFDEYGTEHPLREFVASWSKMPTERELYPGEFIDDRGYLCVRGEFS